MPSKKTVTTTNEAPAAEKTVKKPVSKKPAAKKAPAANVAAEAAPVAAKKPAAKKPAAKKAPVAEIIIQSPLGGEIRTEEILARVGAVDKVYVRVDENKAYWVKGEDTGAVDLW